MEATLHFPQANAYDERSFWTINSNVNMLARGQDPKPLILEFCKPN